MKLYEIIEANQDDKKAILIEKMLPYRKLLLRYYSNVFPSEPCLMVVAVSNATQYAKIVPVAELYDAMYAYLDGEVDSPDDMEEYMQQIAANSMMLKDLLI
jgi:hypothetical protein